MNDRASETNLVEALKMQYGLDAAKAQEVIEYAETLAQPDNPDKITNEYALAKALNDVVYKILNTVWFAYTTSSDEAQTTDIQPLNKSYILLVSELKKIYTWNVKLQEITPKPIWNWLDILEGREWDLVEQDSWGNSVDLGKGHIAQVNKLNILEGIEEPQYTPTIRKLIDEANAAIASYNQTLLEEGKMYQPSKESRSWFIPEYTLTYTDAGSIIINDVLTLKRTQSGSAPRKLMEQAIRQPYTPFKPDLGSTYTRRLSSVLSDMGITGTLKTLFFPVVSDKDGIKFRPVVKRKIADSEHIDTYDLDAKLKEKNAKTEEKPIDLSTLPF